MRVGDGDGEGIGGVGAGDLHAGKQTRDHRVDLRLFRAAGADDRFLDEGRGVFANLHARPRRAHQRHAPGLAELQRRLRVLVDEHLLDRGSGGGKIDDQSFQLVSKRRQAAGQRRIRVGFDLAVGDVSEAVPLGLDDSPSGRAEAGVEAENPQERRSSSSSGTS